MRGDAIQGGGFEALVLQVPFRFDGIGLQSCMIRRKNWTELVLWFAMPLIGRVVGPRTCSSSVGISRELELPRIGEKTGGNDFPEQGLHITWASSAPSTDQHIVQIRASDLWSWRRPSHSLPTLPFQTSYVCIVLSNCRLIYGLLLEQKSTLFLSCSNTEWLAASRPT